MRPCACNEETTLAALPNRSMSYIWATTDWSTGVVSCHCQVVFGAGRHTAPGAAAGGDDAGRRAGRSSATRSTSNARRQRLVRSRLASLIVTVCVPAGTVVRARWALHVPTATRRLIAVRPRTLATMRGAPKQERARTVTLSVAAARVVRRVLTDREPVSSSARPPLAPVARTTRPDVPGTRIASASRASGAAVATSQAANNPARTAADAATWRQRLNDRLPATTDMRIPPLLQTIEGVEIPRLPQRAYNRQPRRVRTGEFAVRSSCMRCGVRNRVVSPAALVLLGALCVALAGAAPAVAAPPVPSFTTDPAEVQVGAPVTFTSTSTDPDGDALTASWDFNGDGTADATGTTVSFTFPSAGMPTVALRVADAAGESANTSRAIAVLAPQTAPPPEPPAPPPPPTNVPPTASFTVAPGAPTVGQTVTFASTSTDSDGTIASQRWDLDGDGQFDDAAGATVTWAYSSFGTRNVRLRVRDNAGANATTTRAVTVNQPPSASFTAAPSVVVAGDAVTFASTSRDADGSIRGLEWSLDGDESFDDGTSSTVSRTYATPGVVVVRLRVTDNLGATAVVTGLVTVVADQPPLASFTFSPTFPEAAAPVIFTSASSDPDGTLTALSWDLDGDGFFDDADGASAAWTYRINGSFMVALRVTDNRGASSIAFQTVVVRGTVSLHKGETSSPAGTSAAGTACRSDKPC